MMTLIVVVLAGAVIGWIASMIMGTNERMGAMANIVAGLIGAAIGRFIAPLVGFERQGTDFSLGGLVFGILGACILIAIVKALTGPKRLTH
ncbi:MAG: GlsB/YeaQ/YmgE family stress response membrane protein [Armatimonadota bacterium]|nr:GlsB/YeaQ/YmgE family stress response membrane protein [Armatimonadota bacterium]